MSRPTVVSSRATPSAVVQIRLAQLADDRVVGQRGAEGGAAADQPTVVARHVLGPDDAGLREQSCAVRLERRSDTKLLDFGR